MESTQSMIRIVGLSATLPNYLEVACFSLLKLLLGTLFLMEMKYILLSLVNLKWQPSYLWKHLGCTISEGESRGRLIFLWLKLPPSTSWAEVHWSFWAELFSSQWIAAWNMLQQSTIWSCQSTLYPIFLMFDELTIVVALLSPGCWFITARASGYGFCSFTERHCKNSWKTGNTLNMIT